MSKLKYIFISGGVISGIGKELPPHPSRIFSIFRISCHPVKFEGYLNIDAGTINLSSMEIRFSVKMVLRPIWTLEHMRNSRAKHEQGQLRDHGTSV